MNYKQVINAIAKSKEEVDYYLTPSGAIRAKWKNEHVSCPLTVLARITGHRVGIQSPGIAASLLGVKKSLADTLIGSIDFHNPDRQDKEHKKRPHASRNTRQALLVATGLNKKRGESNGR